MNYKYWPYDELNIEYDSTNSLLSLALPWIKIKANLIEEDKLALASITSRMRSGQVSADDIDNFSRLLENFKQYPVFYILPQNKIGDQFHTMGKPFFNDSILKTLENMSDIEKNLEGINKKKTKELQEVITKNDFTWDKDAALTFSKVNEKINPESLLTVARRFYMLDVVDNSRVKNIYAKIRDLPKLEKIKATAFMVRQNHYITQRCMDAVRPAVDHSITTKFHVEHFLNEEKGHDALLNRALEELGFEQSDIPVCINSKVIMDLLYFSAKRNFLAFSIIIDFFERSNYSESDPLADLLIDCGMEKSAKFINIHMNINESGSHELMSLKFLESVGCCSVEYAREALILAELTSVFMNRLAYETFNLYMKDKK